MSSVLDKIFTETGSSLKKNFLEYVFVISNNQTQNIWGKMDVVKCLVH